MRGDYNCWRCGQNPDSRMRFAEKVRMMGQYMARLCIPCENDWAVYARSTVEWKAAIEIEGRGLALKGSGRDAESIQWAKDQEQLERRFFDLAKAFAPQPVEEPVEKKA